MMMRWMMHDDEGGKVVDPWLWDLVYLYIKTFSVIL